MTIGEIYFIRERDRMDGQHSTYVKIGLVKSTERDSEERLLQHQTANPRDLVLHCRLETPSPFWVERGLHHRLGRKRVRGEWFNLDLEELSQAVKLAEELATSAFKHADLIARVECLGKTISNGKVLDASVESKEILVELSIAKARIDLCNKLTAEYSAAFSGLDKSAKEIVKSVGLVEEEEYETTVFDEDGFARAYPEIHSQFLCVDIDVKGPFRPKYITYAIREVDPDLDQFAAEFRSACDQVRTGLILFSEMDQIKKDLEARVSAYSWDQKIADASLRGLCGEFDGITGVCTWKRNERTTTNLDKKALKTAHPLEWENFITIKVDKRLKTAKRPSPKLAP